MKEKYEKRGLTAFCSCVDSAPTLDPDPRYTAAIDIWSVGCIFAELLGRKPLFPGKDYVHQLNLITRVLGSPGESDLDFIDSEKAKRYMRSLPHCQRVVLGKYVNTHTQHTHNTSM